MAKGLFLHTLPPPQEVCDIVLAAQSAIGKDIIGFDLIYTDRGYMIIDENGRPGIYKDCLDAAGVDMKIEIASLINTKLQT